MYLILSQKYYAFEPFPKYLCMYLLCLPIRMLYLSTVLRMINENSRIISKLVFVLLSIQINFNNFISLFKAVSNIFSISVGADGFISVRKVPSQQGR